MEPQQPPHPWHVRPPEVVEAAAAFGDGVARSLERFRASMPEAEAWAAVNFGCWTLTFTNEQLVGIVVQFPVYGDRQQQQPTPNPDPQQPPPNYDLQLPPPNDDPQQPPPNDDPQQPPPVFIPPFPRPPLPQQHGAIRRTRRRHRALPVSHMRESLPGQDDCSLCWQRMGPVTDAGGVAVDHILTLGCGHCFHGTCIAEAVMHRSRCPLCGENTSMGEAAEDTSDETESETGSEREIEG